MTKEQLIDNLIWAYKTGWRHSIETLNESAKSINTESLKAQFFALIDKDDQKSEEKEESNEND